MAGSLAGFSAAFGLKSWDIPTPTSGGWDRGDEFRPYRATRDAAMPRAQAVIEDSAAVPHGAPGAAQLQAVHDVSWADLTNEASLIDANWPWDVGWPFQVARSPSRTDALQGHMRNYANALVRLADEGEAALVEVGRIAAEAKAQAGAKAAADKAATEQAAREAAQRAVQAAIAAGANPKQIEAAGRAAAGAVTGYATPAPEGGGDLLPTWAKAALVAAFGGGALYFILRRPRTS